MKKYLPLIALGTIMSCSHVIASRPAEARSVKAQQDIRVLEAALEIYKRENGIYPSSEQGLGVLLEARPGTAPICRADSYIRSMPKDPWGNDYQYLHPGQHGNEIDVWSYGSDGQPGGEELASDIGSWQQDEEFCGERYRYTFLKAFGAFVGVTSLLGFIVWVPIALVIWPVNNRESDVTRKQLLRLMIYLMLSIPVVLGLAGMFITKGAVV